MTEDLPDKTGPSPSGEAWRTELDVLLAEFSAVRAEIDTLKQQLERTYTFLFAVIAAIAASQALSRHALGLVNHHPWIYLAAAVLGLWFPVNNVLMIVDITSCGAYVREVLAPKINALVEDRYRSSQSRSITSDLVIATILPKGDRDLLRAPMSWEEFMPMFRIGQEGRRRLFTPLYFARTGLLYVPSILLVAEFASLGPRFNFVNAALGVLAGGLGALSLAARLSIGSLMRFGLRRGPFSPVLEARAGDRTQTPERHLVPDATESGGHEREQTEAEDESDPNAGPQAPGAP